MRDLAAGGSLDVIEFGGGDGRFFDRIRDVTRTFVNIEPGELELSPLGKRRLDDPAYVSIRCSAEDLPMEDACADLIVAIASLDHVPDPDLALAEAARCLRPGGHLVVTLNNRRSWWKLLLARTGFLRRRERLIQGAHSVLWSLRECREHVGRQLTVTEARSVIFIPYIPLLWRIALPLANMLGPLIGPRLGAHSIVLARKDAQAVLLS